MLNVVTEHAKFPAAILIRAIKPLEGLERMRNNRGGRSDLPLADGPAKLCQALEVDGHLDSHDLCAADSQVFVERSSLNTVVQVKTGPRIGLKSVPEPWLSIPWRFYIEPS
jgi:DNA-3-methyladenine glycosylase